MKNLFIDTASGKIIAAITDEKDIIASCIEENSHDLSTRIMPIIDQVFKKANIVPEQIDTIYIVNGPGSFTGVRIGVTIAKTMAWALKKRIIPISELELLATTPFDGDYIVPYIDARRNASFGGIYDKHGDIYLTDRYISNYDLMNMLPKDSKIQFVSYDSSIQYDTLTPMVDIMKIIDRHKNDESHNSHEIKPEYLKLTEAEENLEKSKE